MIFLNISGCFHSMFKNVKYFSCIICSCVLSWRSTSQSSTNIPITLSRFKRGKAPWLPFPFYSKWMQFSFFLFFSFCAKNICFNKVCLPLLCLIFIILFSDLVGLIAHLYVLTFFLYLRGSIVPSFFIMYRLRWYFCLIESRKVMWHILSICCSVNLNFECLFIFWFWVYLILCPCYGFSASV